MAFDFKKEEDVKEFLTNLGIEYRFQCFHESKPDGCHRLGDFFEAVKKDFKKAANVYKSNCDENRYGKSCYKFGNYSFLGKGCKENRNTAFEYYTKGCETDSPDACLHAGLLLTANEEKDVKKNFVEGLKYLDKGCERDNAMSCFFASGIYLTGKDDVPQDMPKAFNYTLKSCELGNVYACANLSIMYKKGEGVKKNEELANKYKEKAKEMHDQLTQQFHSIEFEKGT